MKKDIIKQTMLTMSSNISVEKLIDLISEIQDFSDLVLYQDFGIENKSITKKLKKLKSHLKSGKFEKCLSTKLQNEIKGELENYE